MKFKRGLLFICLILCLFSIAGVCASETADLIGDANDNLVIDSIDDENDSSGNPIIEEADVGSDKLCDSPGTFTDLAGEIPNDNGELNLTRDYRYDAENDTEFKSIGIHVWSSSITINGNGHTIDGNDQSRAFEFFGSNVTVKNLKIINGLASDYRYAGAISFRNSNCTLINCTFINNNATDGGGAVHLENSNQKIINCTFINNSAIRYDGGICTGGAIQGLNSCSNCIIDNCTFINNTSHYGGAIRWYGGSNSIVSNCIFINNTALRNDYWGGAIDWGGENGTIMDSNFANSRFYDIFLSGENNRIIDCNCSRTNRPIFHKSSISITANDNVSFNETLVLKTSVASGATGNISIFVNDILKENINVGDICYLNDLNCGVYTVKVVYNGDDYYVPSEDVTKVQVNRINSSISLNGIIFSYGDSGSAFAIVDGGTGINASVINHTEAIVNVKDYEITVSGLDVGIYTLVAVVIPDDNHIAANTTACITVKKADPSITISIEFGPGESGVVNVEIYGIGEISDVKVEDYSVNMYVNGTEINASGLGGNNYALVASLLSDRINDVISASFQIANSMDSDVSSLDFECGLLAQGDVPKEGNASFKGNSLNHVNDFSYVKNNAVDVFGLSGFHALSDNYNATSITSNKTAYKSNSSVPGSFIDYPAHLPLLVFILLMFLIILFAVMRILLKTL